MMFVGEGNFAVAIAISHVIELLDFYIIHHVSVVTLWFWSSVVCIGSCS